MSNPIFNIKLKNGNVFQIFDDDEPFCPRKECDNLGKMVTFYKNYSLGDNHDFKDIQDLLNYLKDENCIYLPLYLYDHSGLTMSTRPFSCQWDSGQVGFIYVTREKLKKEFKDDIPSDAKIREYLNNEVKMFDQYLTGQVYGYCYFESKKIDNELCPHCNKIIKDNSDKKELSEMDSCWGFFGDNFLENGILDNLDKKEKNEVIKELKKQGIIK